MKKHLSILGLLLGLALITACSLAQPATQEGEKLPASTGKPVATAKPGSPGPNMPTALPVATGTQSTIAARVNGVAIALDAYQKQFFQFKVALTGQGMDLTTSEGQAALAQVRRQVIDSMIDQVLIEQAAVGEKLAVSDDVVRTKVDEAIAAGGGRDKFKSWLADNAMTEEEFTRMLRQQLVSEQVIERVTNSVRDKAEQVHARHILLKNEAEAKAMLERIKKGEDFVKLAKQYSADELTKADGGDLGWFPRGLLLIPTDVEGAVFALQPGQVSDVVRSQYGYHILQVVERDLNRPLSSEVLQNLKQEAFGRWLADQRARATIEIFVTLD